MAGANPRPFETREGTGTRKGKSRNRPRTHTSALTYRNGIMLFPELVNRKKGQGSATRPNFLFLRRKGDHQMGTAPPTKSLALKLGKFVAIVFTANVVLQIILFTMEPNARTISQVLIAALLSGLFWAFVYRQGRPQ